MQAMLDDWGLGRHDAEDFALAAGSGSQPITATDYGTATADPAPAGAEIALTIPGTATNATVQWTSGIRSVSQGCYDMTSPCTLVLDGNPGVVSVSWNIAPISIPGQPPVYVPAVTFTLYLQGAPGAPLACPTGWSVNPAIAAAIAAGDLNALTIADATPCIQNVGGPALPLCLPPMVRDTFTSACVPACPDGSAPTSGACGAVKCPAGTVLDPTTNVCVTKVGGPGPAATPAQSNTTTIVIGLGVAVLLGGALYYAIG
jgi:hypothetical protein